MQGRTQDVGLAQVLRAGLGEISGEPNGVTDRYMINGGDSATRFALVEHHLAPRALAAPVHRHSREDEYSFVIEGEVGILLGADDVVGRAGDLIFKPRGQWHTFWNPTDEPARILEIISPAGLEDLFRALGAMAQYPEPDTLASMAAEYGCDIDFDATMPVVERHGLSF